jgi:Tol biopolymer transport system component
VSVPPDSYLALSWSSDGRWLAFSEHVSEEEPARIVRVSLQSLEKESLTSPLAGTLGDFDPAFSPDGTQLAFVRSGSGKHTLGGLDVWIQPLKGGPGRRLTFEKYDWCGELAWMPDGTEVLFSAGPFTEFSRVLRMRLAGGEPELVAGLGEAASELSVRGTRATYVQAVHISPARIWRVPGPRAKPHSRAPEVLIESSGSDLDAAWSPDGRRIAFESTRSGQYSIWVCERDGGRPMQLTNFAKATGTPRWSPDGHTIAFDSPEAGDLNVYVIDADGRVARRLTPETSSDYRGVWSRDGRWIYFVSDRSGRSQIWRIPSAGGPAARVTDGGAAYSEVSWDDRHLYFARSEFGTGIWRVPVGGGTETEVVHGPIPHALDWALSARSLVYVAAGGGEDYVIRSLDLRTGRETELFRKTGLLSHGRLAVSADDEWLLFSEWAPGQSQLRLVESFR